MSTNVRADNPANHPCIVGVVPAHPTATPTLVVPWPTPQTSSRARIADHACTVTGLIRTGTQWTKGSRQITQNRLNKRNSRTHKNGLARLQANS